MNEKQPFDWRFVVQVVMAMSVIVVFLILILRESPIPTELAVLPTSESIKRITAQIWRHDDNKKGDIPF